MVTTAESARTKDRHARAINHDIAPDRGPCEGRSQARSCLEDMCPRISLLDVSCAPALADHREVDFGAVQAGIAVEMAEDLHGRAGCERHRRGAPDPIGDMAICLVDGCVRADVLDAGIQTTSERLEEKGPVVDGRRSRGRHASMRCCGPGVTVGSS